MAVSETSAFRQLSGPLQALIRRCLAETPFSNASRSLREYQSSAVRSLSTGSSAVRSQADSANFGPADAIIASRSPSVGSEPLIPSVASQCQPISSLDSRTPVQSLLPLASHLPPPSTSITLFLSWPQSSGLAALGGGFSSGSRRAESGQKISWLVAGGAPVCALSTLATAEAKEKLPGNMPAEVVLYQYEACPFCNKVKAYLDYRDIPYRVVEVNPLGKKELKWSEYKKVPVLVVDDQQMNDSSAIITTLENKLSAARKVPGAEAGREEGEEAKWRRWVDEHLVHLLSPNIYRTPSEAMEAFDYITTNGKFSMLQRTMAKYAGATSMYLIGKRLKKKYNIEDEREALYAAANEWVAALGDRKFLGGDKPNLADLAVFGVLRAIRHMQAGRDMIANTAIGPWYERMEAEVGASARINV